MRKSYLYSCFGALLMTVLLFNMGCDGRPVTAPAQQEAIQTAELTTRAGKTDDVSLNSSYGLYGTVYYSFPLSVASNATVDIYKLTWGGWSKVGSTVTSSCGYYSYDTGSSGTYKVVVDGSYKHRDKPCGTLHSNESMADSKETILLSWKQLHLYCL